MKNAFILLAAIFISSASISQSNNFFITGQVMNKETNLPLQGASVFAENTTIGTTTNSEGKFSLHLPAGGYELVVTFTGFGTESKRITSSDADNRNLFFELKQKEKEMEAVAIISSSEVKDGWQKYGNFFIDHFIGKTQNSALCILKNPEILKFYFSKKRNRLKVMAAEPLQIENKALGYNIKYALDSFTHSYETQVSLYTGYPLFEEMTSTDNSVVNNWSLERQKAYTGSILHFMRSIYNKQIHQEGFEIQFLVSVNGKDSALKLKNIYGALNYQKDDSTQTVEVRPNQNSVGVIYTKEKPSETYFKENELEPKEFQFSILNFLPGESIIIEQNGYYFEQNDISISEYWIWEKVADQLPYNYVPVTN
ncbi:MAG: carboxypeptidase-like regulatory domain-containing protein [Ferruginibacter sp.]